MLDCNMYEKYGQFTDGKWHKSSNGETYEVINPANEEVLGQASKASPEDVNKALLSAQKGLEVWRKTPPWQRAYILRRIADKMREKQDILAKWMTLEVGNRLQKQRVKLTVQQIFMSGMQRRQKEFMVKQLKADLKILEFMFTTNLLE